MAGKRKAQKKDKTHKENKAEGTHSKPSRSLSLQLKHMDCQRLPGNTKTTMRSMTTRRRKRNFGKPLTTHADNHAEKNPTRAWKERAKSRGIALQSRDRTRLTLHTRSTEASRDHCCLAHQQMP